MLMGEMCGCVYNKETLEVMEGVGMTHTTTVNIVW